MDKFDSAKHKVGDIVLRQIQGFYEFLNYAKPLEVEITKKTSSGLCYVRVDYGNNIEPFIEVYDRYGKGKGKNREYVLLDKE